TGARPPCPRPSNSGGTPWRRRGPARGRTDPSSGAHAGGARHHRTQELAEAAETFLAEVFASFERTHRAFRDRRGFTEEVDATGYPERDVPSGLTGSSASTRHGAPTAPT